MSDPFPRDKHLTAIAIGYKNPDTTLIADAVLPRVPVGQEAFTWIEYPVGEAFTLPNTLVGPRSQVNTVEFSGQERGAKTQDFGLQTIVTQSDIQNAPSNIDPKERATERMTNLVLLDREVRVAALVFDPAKYAAANKLVLAGATQWSNSASDPLKAMLTALDSCLIRPNLLTLSQTVWSALSVHPRLVKAANGNDGDAGRISKEKLAELLEISEVVVGSAFVNSVKPGKVPVLLRAWGKHALFSFRDRTVDTAGGLTFGVTAQFGDRVAGSKEVDVGLRGGIAVRAGESVKELIVAPDAAFFFQDAVA